LLRRSNIVEICQRLIRTWHAHRLQLTLWVVSLAIVFANQARSLVAHVQRAADPSFFNDDVRQQIFPFFRLADPRLFRNDYITDYYLANLPVGYRALYTLAGWCGHAETLSKVLPYLLLLLVVAGIGIAAARLSGPIAAATATAIVLGSSLYLDRMGGGLPRAFGYPMMALSLAALALGNAYLAAAVTCVAAAFYPVVAVIAGFSLGAWLLCLPASARGQAQHWSFRRRLALVAMTFGVCLGTLMPAMLGSGRYGHVITPDRVSEFPEIGPQGRYISLDRAPFPELSSALLKTVDVALFGAGTPWSPELRSLVLPPDIQPPSARKNMITESIVLLSLIVWVMRAQKQAAAARLLLLPLAAVLGYLMASRVAPYLYLPQRYLYYAIPLSVALLVSTAPSTTLCFVRKFGRYRQWIVGALSLLLMLLVGGRGSRTVGLEMHIDRNDSVLGAISRLPPSSVVAAWPTGLADFIPYCTQRRIFVSLETHQAFHVDYALEMRRRISALIDAFAADTPEPLIRLNRDFGVTHLVVRDEFVAGHVPRYFRPFDRLIDAASQRLGDRIPETQRQRGSTVVFRSPDVTILSLKDISNER
jgi:hypothetical protein